MQRSSSNGSEKTDKTYHTVYQLTTNRYFVGTKYAYTYLEYISGRVVLGVEITPIGRREESMQKI